jgi:hypothetical protein
MISGFRSGLVWKTHSPGRLKPLLIMRHFTARLSRALSKQIENGASTQDSQPALDAAGVAIIVIGTAEVCGGSSSTGRASDCGSDGCGFNSRLPPQCFSELQSLPCRSRAVKPVAPLFRVLAVGPMQPCPRSLLWW